MSVRDSKFKKEHMYYYFIVIIRFLTLYKNYLNSIYQFTTLFTQQKQWETPKTMITAKGTAVFYRRPSLMLTCHSKNKKMIQSLFHNLFPNPLCYLLYV